MSNIIRAELAWSDTATAAGIIVKAHSPIPELCRRLLAAGHDPAAPLAAWRGPTLCLWVRSIGEAARLTVREETADGPPRFVPHRPWDGPSRVPVDAPMRRNGKAGTRPRHLGEAHGEVLR